MFGVTAPSPQQLAGRFIGDLGAVERLIRTAPAQIGQLLALAEEIVAIGHEMLVIAERLDARAESFGELGERLDRRAGELVVMGEQMRAMGDGIDQRGAEIVTSAELVSQTGHELILMLPALERALDLATPLEGAIDRFGRFVDRFPGAGPPRRRPPPEDDES